MWLMDGEEVSYDGHEHAFGYAFQRVLGVMDAWYELGYAAALPSTLVAPLPLLQKFVRVAPELASEGLLRKRIREENDFSLRDRVPFLHAVCMGLSLGATGLTVEHVKLAASSESSSTLLRQKELWRWLDGIRRRSDTPLNMLSMRVDSSGPVLEKKASLKTWLDSIVCLARQAPDTISLQGDVYRNCGYDVGEAAPMYNVTETALENLLWWIQVALLQRDETRARTIFVRGLLPLNEWAAIHMQKQKSTDESSNGTSIRRQIIVDHLVEVIQNNTAVLKQEWAVCFNRTTQLVPRSSEVEGVFMGLSHCIQLTMTDPSKINSGAGTNPPAWTEEGEMLFLLPLTLSAAFLLLGMRALFVIKGKRKRQRKSH